jgi:2-phosphosulfolactate phosphatase
MSESARPAVFVHLLPNLIAPGALVGGVAVVVDVLRATTVMVHALAAGCEAIVPCGEVDDARAWAGSLPPGTALLAGERQGLPIPGFDLGNSPDDFTPRACRDKTLVMTTTNGTRAILASLGAKHVGIGAMVNAESVTRWAASFGLPIHVVCAGTEGHVSLEDTLLAGALVDRLNRRSSFAFGNDSALIASAQFGESNGHVLGNPGTTWPAILGRGRGGRRVREIGLGKDIEAAARWDSSEVVPVLLPGSRPRIVRERLQAS